MKRRHFVTTGGAVVAGSLLDAAPAEAVPDPGLPLALPKLPYPPEALEPHIDRLTMTIHHGKHHQAYITKLGEALTAAGIKNTNARALIENIGKQPAQAQTAIRNNGGGHVNHTWFWNWMAPAGSGPAGPEGPLLTAIQTSFGTVENMKKAFNAAAATRFGSGWAWLVRKGNGKLAIVSTANQDNPLMKGIVPDTDYGAPLLGIDVWEHAYYLKYQNKRPDYITAWWNVVNWGAVTKSFGNSAG